jgi:eukaryotic-like serine/threonine-protein kinase
LTKHNSQTPSYFGSLDGNMYALDAKNGDQKWIFKTGNSIISSPVVANDDIYFGSNNKKVYALNASTGMKKWEFETAGSVLSSPCVVSKFGNVFYSGLSGMQQ